MAFHNFKKILMHKQKSTKKTLLSQSAVSNKKNKRESRMSTNTLLELMHALFAKPKKWL